jgi:hypothetical protein
MTMLIKRLAAVAAGVFGPKRAGDRLAGSARLEQSGLSSADPTRNADSSTTLWIWTFILAVLVFWAIGGLGELGLSGKGLVELPLGFLCTAGLANRLMALVFISDRSGRDDETNRAAERERSFP